MKKIVWIVIAVLIVIGGIYYFGKPVTNNEILKIGSFLPLTGDLGQLGEEVHRGAELAVTDLQKSGTDIDYISEDDAFDPKLSVSAASKLTNVDKVDAVFTAIVEEAKPTVTIFDKANIPLLVTWDSTQALKVAGPHIFSIGFSTEKDGEIMGDYAYKNLGLRKVAIVGAVDAAMDILVENFKKSFIADGGQIVYEERIQPDVMDARSTITKLNTAKPDGLYVGLIPPQHGPFLKQLKQSGYKGMVMGVDSLLQSEIDAAGNAAEGMYFTNIYADHASVISEKYKVHFGTDPIDSSLVSFGYDGMQTLVAAGGIAKNKNISVSDALKMVKIDGIGGPISMNGTQFSERVEKIYKVTNGKPVEVI